MNIEVKETVQPFVPSIPAPTPKAEEVTETNEVAEVVLAVPPTRSEIEDDAAEIAYEIREAREAAQTLPAYENYMKEQRGGDSLDSANW